LLRAEVIATGLTQLSQAMALALSPSTQKLNNKHGNVRTF
jgi:hypothetical protein